LSACELAKNRSKYNKKEVWIKTVWDLGAETSPFRPEKNCWGSDMITAGLSPDMDGSAVATFNEKTDLREMIRQKRPGLSKWGGVVRLEITARGKFLSSNKRKYGHLNGYKMAFEITEIAAMSTPRLIEVGSKEYYDQ